MVKGYLTDNYNRQLKTFTTLSRNVERT